MSSKDTFPPCVPGSHGYTGADLALLCRSAARESVLRCANAKSVADVAVPVNMVAIFGTECLKGLGTVTSSDIRVLAEDFVEALQSITPSGLRTTKVWEAECLVSVCQAIVLLF